MKISRLILLLKLIQLCYCSIEQMTQQNPTTKKQINLLSNKFYGMMSYYSPMSLQTIFIEHFVELVDQQFLFSANFDMEISIIATCKLNLQKKEITHTLILVQQQTIQTQSFVVSFDPLFYEGQLICTAFSYDANQQQLLFIIQTKNDNQDKIFKQIQLEPKNVQFVFGGVKQNLKLNSFQGQLFPIFDETQINIFFYLNNLITVGVCSNYQDTYIFNSKEYGQENNWQITMPSLVVKDYSIYFWHKFTTLIQFINKIYLIHIDTQNEYNPQYSLGTNTLMITYEFQENNKIMVAIKYYSYEFPYIFYNKEYIQSQIREYKIQEIDLDLIYQWHYVIIQYQQNILYIKIYYPDQQKYVEFKDEIVRQFSYSQFLLTFGESLNLNQNEGIVNQFKFKFCHEDFLDNYQCHFSCATCNGPLQNNCLSCPLNSYRIYDFENHTCICELWTIEQNEQKCFSIQDVSQMTVEYIENIGNQILSNFDQIEPTIICAFGYFLFEDDCYQCPSSSKYVDLICLECLDDWQNWIQNSICQNYVQIKVYLDYEKFQGKYFIEYTSIPSLYLFVDHELKLCNNCLEFCLHSSISDYCNLIKDQHLGKDTYVECSFGYDSKTQTCLNVIYDSNNRKCSGYTCNKQCNCCSVENYCIQCINENDLLLLNNKDCLQCNIKNCKFCFQYFKQSDGIVTSTLFYQNYQSIILDEDYLIGCALCEDNYYYNFVLNICEFKKLQISESCNNYFIDQFNQPICLTTKTQNFNEGIEISDCSQLLKSCQKCVKSLFNKMFCTQCFYGYFQNSNGYCEPCDKEFKECKIQYLNQYDIIIYKLQPFLLAISYGQLIFYPSTNLFNNLIGICQQNNEWNNNCFERQNIPYCKKYYNRVCIECISNPTQVITLYKGQCYLCSYQCKICLPSLQNPSQIKCFGTDFQTNYIDQLSNRVKIKRQNHVKYSSELTVNELIWKDQYSEIFNQQIFQRINFINLLNGQFEYYFYKRQTQNITESYEKQIIQSITVYQDNNQLSNFNSLTFIDYQIINLNNITIQIYDLNKDNIIQADSQYGVHIQINNLLVRQKLYLNLQKYIFLFHNITSLSINNLTLINIHLQNFHLFKFSIFNQTTRIKIHLQNIRLLDCQLINSSIFSLNQLEGIFDQNTINFEQIVFQNCNFFNSFFILFSENQQCYYLQSLYIDGLSIQESDFNSSQLLSNYSATQTTLSLIIFNTSQLINSNFFVADLQFKIQNASIINTIIKNSLIIYFKYQILLNYQKEFFIINGLFLSFLTTDSSFISLSSNLISLVNIQNVEIRNLKSFKEKTKNQVNLFMIQADFLIIKNYFSYDFNSNLIQINILNTNMIELTNFLVQGEKINHRINHEIEFSICPLEQQFLNVYNFTKITIQDFKISNLTICNNNFIKIADIQNLAILNIEHLILKDILLLQLQGTSQTSIISISITKQSQIYFNSFIIHDLYGNNYEKLRKTFEQLTIISVYGPQSSIKISNSYLKSNILTNSTNALIYLELYSILIQNFTNIESNYFTNSIYNYLKEEYVGISIQAIQQLFPIKSEGSVFNIHSQKLELFNIVTNNSVALQGGFCKIEFILDSELYVQNANILNSKSLQDQESKGGSFYVDAKDTNLIIKFINLTVSNSYSLYDGGFLFLIPSDSSNKLILENVKAKGVFSIFRGFISADFSFQTNQNLVILNNIDIQLEYDQIEDMTKNYNDLKDNQLDYVKIKNGYFYFNYCQMQLSNINIQFEIVTQPIFYFTNMQNLNLMNFYLEVGEQTSNTIIEFESIKNSQNKSLILQSFQAKQVQVVIPVIFYLKQCTTIYLYELIYLKSSSIKQIAIKTNNCLLNQLSRVYQNVESIIQFKFLEHFKNFRLSNCLILNFQKNQFQIALIDIYYQTKVKSKIEFLYILNNKCTFSTCLQIRSHYQQQTQDVILKQIYMLYNNNSSYGQLNLKNISYLIKQSYFINNMATKTAGAIYLQNSPLKIKKSYFINNTAPNFGAIYCSNIKNKDREDLISSSIFLNNLAVQDINSFGIEFYSISLMKPAEEYQIISNYQKALKFKNQLNPELYVLYIPSGQVIKNYQIFDMNTLRYSNQELSLKFKLLNYFKENQIIDNYQIKCNVTSNLIDKDLNILQENISKFNAEFNIEDSELNLENQIFILNPYSDNFLEIQIQCDNIENNQVYEFLAKSFKCQMGEFFYENQCIKCNASRGYYSVNPLNGECIKANPDFIKNHTENLLNLNEGFWRLDILTQIGEYCSNNPSNCLGGWGTGDVTCINGHLGALCEACDIYNIRGEGKYSKSRNYKCSICKDYGFLIVEFLFAFIWAFLQIVLAVKSTQLQNQKFLLSKSQTKFYDILVRLSQDQSSSVIKLISNYFQIIMIIYTFKVQFISNLDSLFQFVGNSTYSTTYNFDCYISQIQQLDIIYLNLIFILQVQFLQYVLYLLLSFFIKLSRPRFFSLETIYSSFFYLYLSGQINLIYLLAQLITPKTFSDVQWISANLSYRYWTENHQKILYALILPLLIVFGILIPLFLFLKLYSNKFNLSNYKIKQKYGYLFNEYSKTHFYWESIKLMYRQLLILIIVLLQDYIVIKGTMLIGLLYAYQIIFAFSKPYNVGKLNKFELSSIQICMLSFLLCILQYQIQEFSESLNIICQILILMTLIILVTKSLFKFIQVCSSKYESIIDYIKNGIVKCLHLQKLQDSKFFELSSKRKARVLQHFKIIKQNVLRRSISNPNIQQTQHIEIILCSSISSPSQKQITPGRRFV
ncbi:unnamed protein product [Paramecium sonneborni]|uniref:Transmembrane protein n=1 Tax=Paramecium sonneborni TaxID=65129 RepID=A0A8S1LHH1_9CILI|nr:unnamed protein product [Paramecium sonneborni]